MNELFSDLEPDVALPVCFERPQDDSMALRREMPGSPTAGQSGTGFDVRYRGSTDKCGRFHAVADQQRSFLVDVQFEQGAGVEVEVQRLSSSTVRAIGFP